MGGERQVKKTVKPRVARGDDVSGACAPAPPTGRALTPLNRTSFVENTIKPACGCKNFISFVAFGATFSFRSKVNTLKPHFVRKNTIHPRFARRKCTPFCHSVTSFLSEAGLKRNKEKIFNLICLKPFLILSLPYALPFQGKVKGLPWPFALLNSRKKEGPSVGKILLFYLIR